MKTSKTIQQFNIQVKTKLEELQEVLQWFEGLVFPSIPKKMGWQCEVALVEAFTNAVRHAHHNLPETTPIELEVEFFPNFLEMRIWDRGKPFDLNAELKASELEVNSLEKEGGRGLQFINKLTDEMQYLNLPNRRNCLVMRKKYLEKTVKDN
ncbi:ATP-binding protein [Myxosarcina sp. GI1(2024)]